MLTGLTLLNTLYCIAVTTVRSSIVDEWNVYIHACACPLWPVGFWMLAVDCVTSYLCLASHLWPVGFWMLAVDCVILYLCLARHLWPAGFWMFAVDSIKLYLWLASNLCPAEFWMFAVDCIILYLCLVTMFIDKLRFYCVFHRLDF